MDRARPPHRQSAEHTRRELTPRDIARYLPVEVHRAIAAGADLRDEGSIGIDEALMDKTDIAVGELVSNEISTTDKPESDSGLWAAIVDVT